MRAAIHKIYEQLRRKKAIRPWFHGLYGLVLGGHEKHAPCLRRCDGRLERKIKTATGEKTQDYHRNVTVVPALSLDAGASGATMTAWTTARTRQKT